MPGPEISSNDTRVQGSFHGLSFSSRSSLCPSANEPPGGQEEKTAD
jgi:hypothetical protein